MDTPNPYLLTFQRALGVPDLIRTPDARAQAAGLRLIERTNNTTKGSAATAYKATVVPNPASSMSDPGEQDLRVVRDLVGQVADQAVVGPLVDLALVGVDRQNSEEQIFSKLQLATNSRREVDDDRAMRRRLVHTLIDETALFLASHPYLPTVSDEHSPALRTA